MSRTELAELTGYSQSSITGSIRMLMRLGHVMETGRGRSTGGRRRTMLEFDRRSVLLMLISVDSGHLVARQVDLSGTVHVQVRRRLDPEQPLASVLNAIDALQGPRSHLRPARSSPCPESSPPRAMCFAPALGQPTDRRLQDVVAEASGLHTIGENDVNLLALGEAVGGPPRTSGFRIDLRRGRHRRRAGAGRQGPPRRVRLGRRDRLPALERDSEQRGARSVPRVELVRLRTPQQSRRHRHRCSRDERRRSAREQRHAGGASPAGRSDGRVGLRGDRAHLRHQSGRVVFAGGAVHLSVSSGPRCRPRSSQGAPRPSRSASRSWGTVPSSTARSRICRALHGSSSRRTRSTLIRTGRRQGPTRNLPKNCCPDH